MPSGEIVITLKESQDNTTNAGGPKGTQQQRKQKEKDKDDEQYISNGNYELLRKKEIVKRYIGNKIVNSTVNLVKQGWGIYQQNIGRWSGDISAVRSAQLVDMGLEIASDITGIATAATMGSIVGPAGAIVAASAQTLSTGVKHLGKAINYGADVASNDRSVLFAKMRAGGERNNWSR